MKRKEKIASVLLSSCMVVSGIGFLGYDHVVFGTSDGNSEVHGTSNVQGSVKATYQSEGFDYMITFSQSDLADKISKISVNDSEYSVAGSKMSVFNNNYFIDKDNHKVYIVRLHNNDVIKFDFNDGTSLKYKIETSDERSYTMTQLVENQQEHKIIKIRLVGKFEGALENQQKYDGISGATTNVSTNKNSDVVIQGAEVDSEDVTPKESDWKLLKDIESARIDGKKTRFILDEKSGMKPVYNSHDSAITLSGTPKNPGKYEVKVHYVDKFGRVAESNALPFEVYSTHEKLADQLKLEHAKKMQDGKYLWDMEPWYMEMFGGTDETVTVPKEVKGWFGSHASGVYGELGYQVENEPTQTLIVGKDTNLTMENMKVKSSVKILVKDGGKLNLRDSSVYGKIVVENGGKFQMNYDDYNNKFLTGAQINGQLELKDGAILESSMIYSNTNFLTDGKKVKKNVEPVVLVTGKAKVAGKVFIKGDDSPTGTDPKTNRTYAGQSALAVKNGSLDISKGSLVGAYGGGKIHTTTHGGNAVILDNGTIKGDGYLVAMGGTGFSGDGGNAVAGTGQVQVHKAELIGGNTYSKSGALGKSAEATVDTSKTKEVVKKEGVYNPNSTDDDQKEYWKDITSIPAYIAENYHDVMEAKVDADEENNNGGKTTDNQGTTSQGGNSQGTNSQGANSGSASNAGTTSLPSTNKDVKADRKSTRLNSSHEH